MPIPRSNMITTSFDNVVATTDFLSNVCTTIYVATLPVMIVKLVIYLIGLVQIYRMSPAVRGRGNALILYQVFS